MKISRTFRKLSVQRAQKAQKALDHTHSNGNLTYHVGVMYGLIVHLGSIPTLFYGKRTQSRTLNRLLKFRSYFSGIRNSDNFKTGTSLENNLDQIKFCPSKSLPECSLFFPYWKNLE